MTDKSGKERRKHARMEMGVPVRVQGRDPISADRRRRDEGQAVAAP
jgi:hypothetical protein